jgi:hypothetical protein
MMKRLPASIGHPSGLITEALYNRGVMLGNLIGTRGGRKRRQGAGDPTHAKALNNRGVVLGSSTECGIDRELTRRLRSAISPKRCSIAAMGQGVTMKPCRL